MTLLLDTNLMVDLVTAGSPHVALIRRWLEAGELLGTSAVAWSEFCNGPITLQQKDAVFAVLEGRVTDFTRQQAEEASRLFHRTGRRRGSHADCMIAATGLASGVPVATRNIKDFERFVPFGLHLRAVATEPGRLEANARQRMDRITLEPHDPGWAPEFSRESTAVARALGDCLIAIHHIGSTAVPGIRAKPIIDILAVVRDLALLDARRGQLEAADC